MKAMLLCGSGDNHRALAHKLQSVMELEAVVAVKGYTHHQSPSELALTRARSLGADIACNGELRRVWANLMARYKTNFGEWPSCEIIEVPDVNSPVLNDQLRGRNWDLTLVSGTNLLSAQTIARLTDTAPVMNLHTGLSPFIRGGPNCTNWCLSLGVFNLIGSTVMWIDSGIDSGNIITTECTPLSGEESMADLHFQVMEHAHDLYIRSAKLFVKNVDLPSVRQCDLGEGRVFLSREWGVRAAFRARRNFYKYYNSQNFRSMQTNELPLVELPEI